MEIKRILLLIGCLLLLTGCGNVENEDDGIIVPVVSIPEYIEPIEQIDPIKELRKLPEPVIDEPFYDLSDYERWIVECVVMGESGGEPYDGQVLVAQCILNACLKDGITPSKVRMQYQYSGWNEHPTDSVKQAVSAVFDDGYQIISEPILYFYAPKLSSSKWHETQCFVTEVGNHRFFKQWN